MSLKRILVFILIFTKIVSCGLKKAEEKKEGHDSPNDSSQKPAPIENISKNYKIEMDIPNTDEMVLLNVKRDKDLANVKVESFPKKFIGSLGFRNSKVNLEKCEELEMLANMYKGNLDPEARRKIKFLVRDAIWIIKLDSQINFADPEFEVAVKKLIENKLGVEESRVKYDNNFKLINAIVDLKFENEAISNIIDEKNEFEESKEEFKNLIMSPKGYHTVQTRFKDLICDLYLGNAKLSMKIEGRYNEDGNDFTAHVSFDNIKPIY